jgi:uncharacterized repeat protein (TIGR03803 family)
MNHRLSAGLFVAFLLTLMALVTSAPVLSQSAQPQFTVLHSFQGGDDGAFPGYGALTFDAAGNLYGTTTQGGNGGGSCSGGCGTVYEIDTGGQESILYRFSGQDNDARYPYGSLFRDSQGNFYGTSWGGGTSGNACFNYGCGTVWSLSASGQEKVLYNFTGQADGATPTAGLTPGTDGRLYSTTHIAGVYNWGTVFAIDKTGSQSDIHNFDGATGGGGNPWGGLVRDASGTLYGMTFGGGGANTTCGELGCGVIYKISETGTETVLYRFTGQEDGKWPAGNLVRDSSGNLYGTSQGGTLLWGAIFKLDPAGNFTVLHSFTGGAGGGDPWAGLVHDASGRLYGTTLGGGGSACFPYGCGTVFVLEASGSFHVLHRFTGGADGWAPSGALLLDGGNLYGTAGNGGAASSGVVFKISR